MEKHEYLFKVFFYLTFMQHLYIVIYSLFVGQIYILKTVRWSMHLEISVDPTKPLGHRARLIGPGLCLCYVFVLSSMSAKFACTFSFDQYCLHKRPSFSTGHKYRGETTPMQTVWIKLDLINRTWPFILSAIEHSKFFELLSKGSDDLSLNICQMS